MVDSNTLRILDGAGLVNGAFWEIEGAFEELVIENGTPGYNRIDLVVAHIETAPQETIELRVLKGEETTGEPVMPAHIEGDLNNGDTVVEQPLHAVTLDGINPGEPVPQFEVTPSFAEFRDSLSQSRVQLAPIGFSTSAGGWSRVVFPTGLPASAVWVVESITSGRPAALALASFAREDTDLVAYFRDVGGYSTSSTAQATLLVLSR